MGTLEASKDPSSKKSKAKFTKVKRQTWKEAKARADGTLDCLTDADTELSTLICEGGEEAKKHKGVKWERHECTIFSKLIPHVKTVPSERSRTGRHYTAANMTEIKNVGESRVELVIYDWVWAGIKFQNHRTTKVAIP